MLTTLRFVLLALAALLAGCASPGVMLAPDTLMLGEVSHVLSAEQIEAGRLGPDTHDDRISEWVPKRFSADLVARGRVVAIRTGIYWVNTISGVKHDMLRVALAPDDLKFEPGNIVEVAVGSEWRPEVIRRVRAADLAAGPCFYDELPHSAALDVMGAVSLVGPRGSATLYCRGIEAEGWIRPRSYWHKLPDAVAAPPAAQAAALPVSAQSVAPRPISAAVSPEARTPTDHPTPAQVMLVRRKEYALPLVYSWTALPVSIDGRKVAELEAGECEVVLLEPGRHVVEAGTAAMSNLTGLPRLELELEVDAGERIVAEYLINEVEWKALGMKELFTPRATWGPKVFSFTHRPATPKDRCALRGEPVRVQPSEP